MNILVIGGTHFLGRHFVEAALKKGHTLTLFHRGRTNPGLFPEVEHVYGDRRNAEDLDQLKSGSWDALLDTSAYFPRDVELLLERVAPSINHYTFISSISVYAPEGPNGPNEDSTVMELTEEMPLDQITHENYGPLKVAAERKGEELMPGKTLVIRPGLIVGPYDPTDRFTYWPWRVDRAGTILAPGDPNEPIQYIDARDLAEWMLDMVERKETGVYNATGPNEEISMGSFLEETITALEKDAKIEWADENFLLEKEIAPFMEMPLWVPAADNGFSRTDISRAIEAGLRFRSLDETVKDTLEWFKTTERAGSGELRAGINRDKEEGLLNELETQNS